MGREVRTDVVVSGRSEGLGAVARDTQNFQRDVVRGNEEMIRGFESTTQAVARFGEEAQKVSRQARERAGEAGGGTFAGQGGGDPAKGAEQALDLMGRLNKMTTEEVRSEVRQLRPK